jgi:hypothetical protein
VAFNGALEMTPFKFRVTAIHHLTVCMFFENLQQLACGRIHTLIKDEELFFPLFLLAKLEQLVNV